MKKLLLILLLIPSVVSAQGLPVFDVQAILETIRIVKQVQQTYEWTRQQYETVQRLGRPAPSLNRYLIPGLPLFGHDASKYGFAMQLLQALNSGDAGGVGYTAASQRLLIPSAVFYALPTAEQQVLRAAYAGIEISDSVSTMSAHQVGIVRTYHSGLQTQIDALESDTVSGPSSLTANLDKVAVGQLIARRQDNTANQLISSLVEQQLVAAKRKRDSDVGRMNMIINQQNDNGAASQALVSGATSTIRGWRIQ